MMYITYLLIILKSIEISRRNKMPSEIQELNESSHSKTQNWSSSRSKKVKIGGIDIKNESRKTYSQKIKLPINANNAKDLNKKFVSIGKVKGPKTYYNIYESNNKYGDDGGSLYASKSIWRKPKYSTKTDNGGNYPVYTQLAFHNTKKESPGLKHDTINAFTY